MQEKNEAQALLEELRSSKKEMETQVRDGNSPRKYLLNMSVLKLIFVSSNI